MNTSDITMASLALPAELYWDGKLEPISPPSSVLIISELSDDWLIDSFVTGLPPLLDDEEDNFPIKGTLEVTEKLPKGDDVVIQLSDLKDEYILDPKLLDYPIGIDVAQPHTITKVQAPLAAASTVFNQSTFDNAVLAQLTPPQSPPRNSAASSPVHHQNNLFIESPNNFTGAISEIISAGPQSPASPPEPIAVSPNTFLNALTPSIIQNAVPSNFTFHWSAGSQEPVIAVSNDNEHVVPAEQNNSTDYEMLLFDEIVNTRAKELEEWKANEESETQSSFSQAGSTISDDDEIESSCCSSSVSSPNYQASSDDQITTNADSLQKGSDTAPISTTKKRGVEDRKNRKKEQNKNAATRYRQRKKQEMENILVEELSLRKKNTELQKILEDAKREAKYLRNLLREFYENDKLKP